MKLSETQIEDLIYNSPWLLDERYILPNIIGSRGQVGRQINPSKSGGKYIDLLFKDTRDNRPVIVELKKGILTRDSIGQILEYKGLLLTFDDDEKEIWLNEFGSNYYCPKLILIGSEINESIRIAANFAGIEVRTFPNEIKTIDFTTFEDIEKKQQEWNLFRQSGKRALYERVEWIESLLDRINEYLISIPEISSIKQVPINNKSRIYIEYGNPFINIPFYFDNECIAGMYEFFDDQLPFDDQYLYYEFAFVNADIEKKLKDQLVENVIQFCTLHNLSYTNYGTDQIPIIRINRETLESINEFNELLGKLLNKGIEIYHECYSVVDS